MREALGLSPGQVAVGLGVDPRIVTRWESGESPVPTSSAAMLTLLGKPDLHRRLRALAHGAEPDDDPIGDLVGQYDQAVENLRALRAGRAAQTIPPARDLGVRRPEGVLKTAGEESDPLRGHDWDREVRAARKRGLRVTVEPAADVDPDDPIGSETAEYDVRVAKLRAAHARRLRGKNEHRVRTDRRRPGRA